MKTTEEIIEGNRLIAKFMGLKQVRWDGEELLWVKKDFVEDFTDVNDYSNVSKFDWEHASPQTEELYYHSSWDWLMPVVEKILCCSTPEIVEDLRWDYHYYQIHDALFSINIENVWKSCVEFIKWYNEKN